MQNNQNFDIKLYHDDGRPKRTGTVFTASSHMITAVIGPAVLSLAWANAQLGWIAGPTILILFSVITHYTSSLLASCYRDGDSNNGRRHYTYMDAVRSNLGGMQVKLCGAIQYLIISGAAIGFTLEASKSMMTIERSNCFHTKGHEDPCKVSSNYYKIAFGVVQVILSQIPNFKETGWLSIVENGAVKGSLTGVSIGEVTEMEKIWGSLLALGAIAFSYSYSLILIEIQDTIKSPPSEYKTMKKASLISVSVTAVFYMLCGCFGYAAFGDMSPDNLLTGFGFYNPYWLLDITNTALVIHLVGAYQVFCQPLFAFIEKLAQKHLPESTFSVINKEIPVLVPGLKSPFKLNLFRLVLRSVFVVTATMISMAMPFFGGVVGVLGALGFWPLTVFFPVEMYISSHKIPKWSSRWICLQMLSGACLIISIAAAAGSVAGVVSDLKVYKPFKTSYE
ncbi:amino acid permease 3-like isoform X2 [Salvia hispanica]|uniref:amino acid permease 3-like isoform X2 n=1 Tax=Salvia hispanica TaxID=49212 RepID=UPI002009DBDE|nr:amino acid permease 3-like isoform X2 [Salvia hispanica]